MSRFTLAALALTVACVSATPARAQLIINGGFELPPGNNAYNAGDPSITGWTITSGSVDIIDEIVWDAHTGNQSLDLNGESPAVLQQSFATVIGQTYSLSFAYSDNSYPEGYLKSALVEVLGMGTLLSQTITHQTHPFSYTDMNYTSFAASFVADSTTATLRFTGTNDVPANAGIVLDSVSVDIVPEPASLVLFGGGLRGLVGYRWRRRR